ncbi:MAG: DUF1318 domain-containing protein [Verrucomicrobiota bacterium]
MQNLKNDRVVGENNQGYLTIIRLPEEPSYAQYALRIVEAENKDRQILYKQAALREKEPMQVIENQYSLLWREHSFPGEWIQRRDGKWLQR